MAKRKPNPKATYVYVPDETAKPGSKKRGKTGGIKKEKTSGGKSRPQSDVVRPAIPGYRTSNREEIAANVEAREQKRRGAAERRKREERELSGELTADEKKRNEEHIKKLPLSGSPRLRIDRTKKRANPFDPAAKFDPTPVPAKPATNVLPEMEATVPASGTPAGGAPSDTGRGAEFGGAITVGRGLGAPDAISARQRGGKTKVTKKTVVPKVSSGVEIEARPTTTTASGATVGGGVRKTPIMVDGKPEEVTVKSYQPVIEPTPTSTRTMRTKESIKETRRKAKNRLPAGLKTTEFRPMDVAAPASDSKKRRAEKKMRKRVEKGKTKLPTRILSSAASAEQMAAETAAAKSGSKVTDVSGRNASAFVYSDEALAQDLAQTHFKGHSASDISDYVKSTGSDLASFHKHVNEAHRAETKRVKVGPPGKERTRSAGKITRWRIAGAEAGEKAGTYVPETSYSGWQHVNTRDPKTGANIKEWKKFSAPKKKGTLSHIDYLNMQISNFKENRAMAASDTREANRSRRVSETTAALVGAMGGASAAPEKKEARPPKGKSGKVRVTAPRPEGVQGPELESGKFSDKVVSPDKSKFTEVKKPRKRNLNYPGA